MTIPDYQSLMLPVLQAVGDGKEHVMNDILNALSDKFQLTNEEKNRTKLSGGETVFHNRVWWARTHILRAGLIESTQRGIIKITSRGLQVLQKAPRKIDNKFLRQFPEYRWKSRSDRTKTQHEERISAETAETRTPQEIIESNYRGLRQTLVQDLLDRIKGCSPEFFEGLVVDLLAAMGYGGSKEEAGEAIGRRREIGGIDGVIKEDRLGLDVVYIQAKRWENPVGRPVVSQFSGSLESTKATKGVLITTSWFSDDAKDFVKSIGKRIVLIDGEELANLMITYGVGVTLEASYDIKKIDPDYFEKS